MKNHTKSSKFMIFTGFLEVYIASTARRIQQGSGEAKPKKKNDPAGQKKTLLYYA